MKRQPKQQRSRQIVDAVLDGATRILQRNRLVETTTNKIAELAGVGIGSLYDYFPNKEAIVISLMDRHIFSVQADFHKLLQNRKNAPVSETMDEVAEFLEDRFLRHNDFLREIFLLAPVTGRMEILFTARVETSGVLATYFIEGPLRMQPLEAERRAFLLVHGVIGLVDSFIMVNPPQFTPADFAAELRRLIFWQLKLD